MPLAASPARAVRRWTRSLLSLTLALGVAGAVGACRDDDPTGTSQDVVGTYNIESYDGQSAAAQNVAGEFVISANNRWTLYLENTDGSNPFEDDGTFTRSGNNFVFRSAEFFDEFTGSVSGRTLTINNYDETGEGNLIAMVFRR